MTCWGSLNYKEQLDTNKNKPIRPSAQWAKQATHSVPGCLCLNAVYLSYNLLKHYCACETVRTLRMERWLLAFRRFMSFMLAINCCFNHVNTRGVLIVMFWQWYNTISTNNRNFKCTKAPPTGEKEQIHVLCLQKKKKRKTSNLSLLQKINQSPTLT